MINKITNDDIKKQMLVLLFEPEQKLYKDPPMIVIQSAPVAQNAILAAVILAGSCC